MKKFYTIFSIFAVAVSAYSQTTLLNEDFASVTSGNNTTTAGSNAGWTGNANFPTVAAAYQAGGAVRIGSSSAGGSLTSKVVDLSTDGGAFALSFDVKGWTTVEGDITVNITGQPPQTVKYTSVISSSFQTISLKYTGGAANSTVIIATSAKRAFIDNVKIVTTPATMAVIDAAGSKKYLVKNTIVENQLVFGAKSDVQIIDMNGKVVKSLKSESGAGVDISTLPKGIYIVTGLVEGDKVSQKIIKK